MGRIAGAWADFWCATKSLANHLMGLTGEFDALTERLQAGDHNIESAAQIVEKVLMQLKIMTINAGIEAARLGEQGKAFTVVTRGMQEMLLRIRKAIDNIRGASEENRRTMELIRQAEKRLHEVSEAQGPQERKLASSA